MINRRGYEPFESQRFDCEPWQCYRDLMEASLDGIAIIDQKHRICEANSRFAQMLGYTMEEMVQLHTWDWEVVMKKSDIRANFRDLSTTKTTFETRHRRKDGSIYEAEVTACGTKLNQTSVILAITRDITKRKQNERKMKRVIRKLQEATKNVKMLRGLLPICSNCKKIRDDQGYWKQIESYISDHSEVEFSHSICRECADKLYGDQTWYDKIKNE